MKQYYKNIFFTLIFISSILHTRNHISSEQPAIEFESVSLDLASSQECTRILAQYAQTITKVKKILIKIIKNPEDASFTQKEALLACDNALAAIKNLSLKLKNKEAISKKNSRVLEKSLHTLKTYATLVFYSYYTIKGTN